MVKATHSAVACRFVAEAAANGVRAPVRVLNEDAHAWIVSSRGRELLLLDEYGDLWWGRAGRPGEARVHRACWPEEADALADEIAAALDAALRARAVAS